MILEGDGCYLQPLQTVDAGWVMELFSQESVWANIASDPLVINEENVLQFLTQTEPGTTALAMGIYEEHEVVGVITLNCVHPYRHSAYLGVIAIDEAQRGKPHALQATRLVLEYGFNHLNLNRFYAHTWGDNPRMSALYRKVGAVLEGTERQHAWKNGKWVDRQTWGLLRSEYNG